MIFSASETREDILELANKAPEEFDNILALACVGTAFSSISVFEDSVAGLIMVSKATLSKKLDGAALKSADLFQERHRLATSSTLGKLITVLEESGIEGRDIRYLRKIVELRNDFIHRFMNQVPLPGDWERYRYTLEDFSHYTRWVARHINFASSRFPRIMVKHGLLAGNFGSFGALLWHPDSWEEENSC